MCDFDMATIPPEMRKLRRVVVLSPRSYNHPHKVAPGKCVVVPLSATEPRNMLPSHVYIPAGQYLSLSKPVWAICEMIAHMSHTRLDRVAVGTKFLSEKISDADLVSIESGIFHALGLHPR